MYLSSKVHLGPSHQTLREGSDIPTERVYQVPRPSVQWMGQGGQIHFSEIRIFAEFLSQSASPEILTGQPAFRLSGRALVCIRTLCTEFHACPSSVLGWVGRFTFQKFAFLPNYFLNLHPQQGPQTGQPSNFQGVLQYASRHCVPSFVSVRQVDGPG